MKVKVELSSEDLLKLATIGKLTVGGIEISKAGVSSGASKSKSKSSAKPAAKPAAKAAPKPATKSAAGKGPAELSTADLQRCVELKKQGKTHTEIEKIVGLIQRQGKNSQRAIERAKELAKK